ncbi:MAG: S-layer homology domain-containing protein [Clostridia bacterium]|nr:S-layer homology domain-containing protein [Clostridia bacterium]
MKQIKIIVSLLLVCCMLLPVSSFALFDEMDDICVWQATPTLDGVINKDDGWSDAVELSNDTLAIVSHNKQNAIDMKGNAYMAYDECYLYFAGEISEFGENMSFDTLICPSDLSEPVDGGNFGFDGDAFGITIDVLGILTADSKNYEKIAPYYSVGFDLDGNAKVYHANGTANEIIDSEYASATVAFTESGWNVEACVSLDVVVADICANAGIAIEDFDFYSLLYGNIDSKMSFVYKSNRVDLEAEEVITYAEYATVADTALDGTPGYMLFGTPVKSLGLIYYFNHEHKISNYFYYASDDDFATFDNEGIRYILCDVCGGDYGKEIVPVIPFTDVKAGQWYENALLRCYNWGYFNGMSETKFGPNVTMTRAMFVQVLANFWGVDTSEFACDNFTDVKPGQWYYNSVSWAYEVGITSGTSETTFSPNKPLTRQEAAALFANVIKVDGLYKEPTIEFDAKYTDTGKIAPWAEESMLWAVENGIISGTSETTLAPTGQATRMQVAQMLCQFEAYVVSLLDEAE